MINHSDVNHLIIIIWGRATATTLPNKKYTNKLTTFYLVAYFKNSISDLQVEPLSEQKWDLVKNREPSFSYGLLLRNCLSV